MATAAVYAYWTMAAAATYTAVETHEQGKEAKADRAKAAQVVKEQQDKMDADVATQKAEQQKDLELQRAKETRMAKRGQTGYAGTVLTEGVKPGAAATKRTKLGVG